MTKRDQLPTIRPSDLGDVAGGWKRPGGTNWQMQQALQTITDSLSDLKNQNNGGNNQLSKLLPYVVMARVMRGY